MDYNAIPKYNEPHDKNTIVIRHKKPFFDWLNKTLKDGVLKKEIEENMYLITGSVNGEDIADWLMENFDNFFHDELNKFCTDQSLWPENRTYEMFCDWFDFGFSSIFLLGLEDFGNDRSLSEDPMGLTNPFPKQIGRDQNGNLFETIRIGEQKWMADNLNVDKFTNGDPVPHAQSHEEWLNAGKNKQPAFCHYNFDPANGMKYGELYNWYAVDDSRDLAPTGWHLPSHLEWIKLERYLERIFHRDIYGAGLMMKSDYGWEGNGGGTNQSSFSALPGGYINNIGRFTNIGSSGYWWTISEFKISNAFSRILNPSRNIYINNLSDKANGFSVRCVRD